MISPQKQVGIQSINTRSKPYFQDMENKQETT
jgi:hypothetical protein